ncbi:UDP-Glycosyltransferase superfamily protein [Perilla frutescens var. hirtella]|nr:UDP-Glycosyltransferase superfamily protein [Perilla frutescens var. hirtella]
MLQLKNLTEIYREWMLFEGFPKRCDALDSMRSRLLERVSSVRWATEWEENAKPLIKEVSLFSLVFWIVVPLGPLFSLMTNLREHGSFRLYLNALAEILVDESKNNSTYR